MLDGPHPVGDRADDRLRDVGVGQHVGPPRLRFLADGPDLAGRVLGVPDGIGRGRHPAPGHDLDLVGALSKLVAGGPAALVDAVRDASELLRGGLASAGDHVGGHGPGAEVPVPTGLGEGEAGDEEAGADEEAVLDRVRHPPIGTGRVPHGGEAPHQHRLHELAGAGGQVGDGNIVDCRDVEMGGLDVHVGVDEAGQQGAAGEVDRPVRGARRYGPVGDLLDPLPLDEHVVSLAAFGRLPVEDARVREENAGHVPVLPAVPDRRRPRGRPGRRRRASIRAPGPPSPANEVQRSRAPDAASPSRPDPATCRTAYTTRGGRSCGSSTSG